MEENKKNRLNAQDKDIHVQTDTDNRGEDEDVLEQMKHYLVDRPGEMAGEAEEYMAEHPDTPEAAAARKDRFFARLEKEKAEAEEAATAVSEAITDPAVKVPFYRRRSGKILVAVAACLAVLIAVPMVSQSARVAMRDVVLQIFGPGASGFTYNEATYQPLSEEEMAWNEVAERLDVKRIGFEERPDDLEYMECEINELVFEARIYYKQKNQTICIIIQKQISDDMSSNGALFDRKDIADIEIPLIGQTVKVYEWETNGVVNYYTAIPYENVRYSIYGYDLDVMKAFVSNIYFY